LGEAVSKVVDSVKNNKGFSLVELIVVMAIMVIVSTGIVTILLSLSDYKCKAGAETICTYLNNTKSEALAKQSAYMNIELDTTDGNYYVTTSKNPTYDKDSKLGKNIVISYDTNFSTGIAVDSTHSIILTYSRGSGAFQYMKKVSGGSYVDMADSSGNYIYCKAIHIQNAKKTKGYTITLNKDTGKYECKKD
jgi:prepilin-type N-terminal cleavage/methylation domain-containing protein